MCAQYGDPVDWDKCPPDWEDFPDYVHISMSIFNALPDLYVAGGMDAPLYTGKDISALPVLFDLYDISDKEDKIRVFDTIQFLDGRAREQAMAERKKAAKQK